MLNFYEPAKYLMGLQAGEYVRYGALIKSAASGQIIGHVKEAGPLLGKFALGSMLSSATSPISAIGAVVNGLQLNKISHQIEQLQQVTMVAAGASIIGVGVSLAGFALVMKQVKEVSAKVDGINERLSQVVASVAELKDHADAMRMAALEQAGESLKEAEIAHSEQYRYELCDHAARTFAIGRKFYKILLTNTSVWHNPNVSLDDLQYYIRMLEYCIMGELQAGRLRGDLGVYQAKLATVKADYMAATLIDTSDIYEARVGARDLVKQPFANFEQVSRELSDIRSSSIQGLYALDSQIVEVKQLAANDMSFEDYHERLAASDEGIVVLGFEPEHSVA